MACNNNNIIYNCIVLVNAKIIKLLASATHDNNIGGVAVEDVIEWARQSCC